MVGLSRCLIAVLFAGALSCVSAMPAWASTPAASTAPSASGPRLDVLEHVFAEQKAEILGEIRSGRYAKMPDVEKREVIGVLDRMSRLLEGVESAADMTPEGRVALLNNQNLVNILLTKADNDQRVVCRRGTTVGSHFRTTQCETVAERRERHRLTRLEVESTMRNFNQDRLHDFACGPPPGCAF
jgi:hypothetical protein